MEVISTMQAVRSEKPGRRWLSMVSSMAESSMVEELSLGYIIRMKRNDQLTN